MVILNSGAGELYARKLASFVEKRLKSEKTACVRISLQIYISSLYYEMDVNLCEHSFKFLAYRIYKLIMMVLPSMHLFHIIL